MVKKTKAKKLVRKRVTPKDIDRLFEHAMVSLCAKTEDTRRRVAIDVRTVLEAAMSRIVERIETATTKIEQTGKMLDGLAGRSFQKKRKRRSS